MSESPDIWGSAMVEMYSPGPLIAAGMSGITTISTPIWTVGQQGISVRNALKYWSDHMAEFPELNNALEYVRMTHEFTTNPPETASTLSRFRNNDLLIYDPPTITLAVAKNTRFLEPCTDQILQYMVIRRT